MINSKNSINIRWLVFLSLLCSALPPSDGPRIFFAGGSTMADKVPKRYPETGWGQVFAQYFKGGVEVINCASNGASTKTFISQKRWDKLLKEVVQGDYVFIQFGHNDEKVGKPQVGTSLKEYEQNLLKFVREVKQKHAIPVLMTPIMRRSVRDGKFYNSHGEYPVIVQKVAISENVAFIDMCGKSMTLLKNSGVNESKRFFLYAKAGELRNYPNGIKDNTHFSEAGAHQMAKLAIEGIRELNLPLALNIR